ncbi:exodeoxyribonuclease VII small subunit [Deinococcus sp. SL84]|uniref:exodeoxyribonuclease VII small subunit n=1 Tax=Deinococcus sp. SL84 TaxID=2994663 RepID=UPI0022744B70|nr:exodeoxyribonuclease VII small subunit [Deinococcus sp. SL84]MCY1703130.1 exodeoxyribonuclease VII small subunit [Deinococcus sp. SL84]
MPRAKVVQEPTYREAYATLSRIVTELENGETDLDRVLPLLEEARAAYEVCQGRIAAVAQAVGSAGWLEDGAEGTEGMEEDGADGEEE